MNSKALVFAVAAACIGSAAPAFAQHDDRDHDKRYAQRYERHDSRHDDRRERWERKAERAHEREHRREIRREVRHYNQYHRGAGPRFDLYAGSRLPSVYHGDRYVVRDYHRYRLSAPPRGMHWVRAGNDYLLVALATGIIAQVLLN